MAFIRRMEEVLFLPHYIAYGNTYKYVLCVIDVASRYKAVRPLRTNKLSEVTDMLEDIVRAVHKHKHFKSLQNDLLFYIHKKQYYKSLHKELLPVAWHPDRYINWCLDEDEKRDF